MSTDKRDLLLRQFETASKLLHFHLDGLTLDEVMWRPAIRGLHVHREEKGGWVADSPEHEGYNLGPPSAAWIAWHIVYWWSMVLNHSFGDRDLSRDKIKWAGDGFASQIEELERKWLAAIAELDDEDLRSGELSKWPMSGRPFADIVGWVNIELTKNASELGLIRFFYAARQD